MDIDKIMAALKTHGFWKSTDRDAPELAPCGFCGGKPIVIVHHPIYYGASGATVLCSNCKAQGPKASIHAHIMDENSLSTPLLPESLERGIKAAVEAWNSRSADRKQLGPLIIPPQRWAKTRREDEGG